MMLHRLIIIARNDQFPTLSREAERTAAGPSSPKNARSAGAVDQGGTGNEVRG
jgi:hypothetical protein